MADPGSDPRAGFQIDFRSLLRRGTLLAVRELTDTRTCHLVGGILRDTALGMGSSDVDLVVSGSGRRLAERLADRFRTRVIQLGGDRFAAYRVPSRHAQIDIWDRGTADLETDLRRRDLTIHSFAVDLHTGEIIDPFDGCHDLSAGILRMTTRFAFDDDPLRVMRLCRFAALLSDFRVDPGTLRQAARSSSGLEGVASERVRQEIESSLKQPRAGFAIALWLGLGVFPDSLLGETMGPDARHRLRSDLAKAFAAIDKTARLLPGGVDLAPAHMALLLRSYEKLSGLATRDSVAALRQAGLLTRRSTNTILRVLASPTPPRSEPERRWYLHSLGDLWPAAVCLASASAEIDSTPGTGFHADELGRLIHLATERAFEVFDPPPLVTGTDLQRELGLEAGPRLGRILARLRRLQIEGTVRSRQQALELAGELKADSNLDPD